MPRRVLALCGWLILIWAAPASATTYCVAPASGCGGGSYPTLAGALTAASSNPGADDVRLGAGTYTDGPWSYDDPTSTNPVTIRGAGSLDSQLVSMAGTPTLTLTNGSADNVVVRGPVAGVAVRLIEGTLSASQVLVTNNGIGVNASDATLDHVSIVPSSGASGPHTAVQADTTTVRDSSMSTTNGVEVTNPPVDVRRSTIVTKGYGLQSGNPDTTISDSLIVLNDPTAVGVQGICDLTVGPITIAATNLTVRGAGPGGIAFRSIGGQLCGGYVAVSSSLVYNVGTTAACAPGIGTASVAFRYSDIDLAGPGKVAGTCTPPLDAGGNFLADPKLAIPDTLQPVPRFDSPLVDSGDPAAPGSGQPTDIAGLPRAVNGRRDVGAFEYGRRAPSLTVTSSPAMAVPAEPVTFTAATSDADLGDVVTVTWTFDDGAAATGTQSTHAFTKPGMHTATATATDSAGVMTVQAVTVPVTSNQLIPPVVVVIPSSTKLVLDRLAVVPARFRALGSGPPLISGRARGGATLSYRVTGASTIRFTVQRLLPGRRMGTRCGKPSRTNDSYRRCTRVVDVAGSIADTAAPGGTRRLRFTGRIAGKRLAAGSYRLSARATSGTDSGTATPARFWIVHP